VTPSSSSPSFTASPLKQVKELARIARLTDKHLQRFARIVGTPRTLAAYAEAANRLGAPGSSWLDLGERPFYPLPIPLPPADLRVSRARDPQTASRMRSRASGTR
jgi:hypothetical protein